MVVIEVALEGMFCTGLSGNLFLRMIRRGEFGDSDCSVKAMMESAEHLPYFCRKNQRVAGYIQLWLS